MFITALTSVRYLSLSWASPIQSIYPHSNSWRWDVGIWILILFIHLRLGLPSGLLPFGLPSKTLHTPLSSPISATCLDILWEYEADFVISFCTWSTPTDNRIQDLYGAVGSTFSSAITNTWLIASSYTQWPRIHLPVYMSALSILLLLNSASQKTKYKKYPTGEKALETHNFSV